MTHMFGLDDAIVRANRLAGCWTRMPAGPRDGTGRAAGAAAAPGRCG
ncbi:hypothetical protein I552_2729 [Mycobacterium xenopi 3993]|nr:hypothetical protein I552_2729 [Mycobacterium xenopi 3993]